MKRIRIALDEILTLQGVTRYELAKKTKIDFPTIDRYYKNKVSRYDSSLLLKMCTALECEPGDIVKIVEE